MDKPKRKVIAIVGATASGKTGIGVKLAKEFNGEIISADSRQVYRGLDLGTGKDLAEYDGVRYHLIDIVDTEEKMTLFDYLPLARRTIEDIFSRGKLPIIVGGTGLYVQGIVEGFNLVQSPTRLPDGQESKVQGNYTRSQLENITIEELNLILQKIDPSKYEKVDLKNKHRLIRAIELAQEGFEPVKIKPDFEVLQIGLDIPRKELHVRIDRRVEERFEQGMLEEVEQLLKKGVSPEWLLGLGLEYRIITQYLLNCHFDLPCRQTGSSRDDNNLELENMKQTLKYKIHQFARRQLTWFRRFSEINWLSNYDEIKRFVKIFITH